MSGSTPCPSLPGLAEKERPQAEAGSAGAAKGLRVQDEAKSAAQVRKMLKEGTGDQSNQIGAVFIS